MKAFGGLTLGLGVFVLYDKSSITGILSRVPSSYTANVEDVISNCTLFIDYYVHFIDRSLNYAYVRMLTKQRCVMVNFLVIYG